MQDFWSGVVMGNVKECQVVALLCTFCEHMEKQIAHQTNPAAPYPASDSCALTAWGPGIWHMAGRYP